MSELLIWENTEGTDWKTATILISYGSCIKNDNGKNLRDKTFGGVENDRANSIIQTSDGKYVVVGYTESKGKGKSDMWMLKLDKNGDLH